MIAMPARSRTPRTEWIRARAVRKPVVSFTLGLALGCADIHGSDRDPRHGPEGGTAVVAYTLDIPGLGVLHTLDAVSAEIQREVLFTPLVKFDAALEPVPWLAERWDTVHFAPDSIELTFHLRNDVHWHDGTPTTAEDVRFTFERVRDPVVGASVARHFAGYSPWVEVRDPHTIRFRVGATAAFLHAWRDVPPLPRHVLEDVGAGNLATHAFGRAPLGNGPFRFVRRRGNDEWIFEANHEFPAALGGSPAIGRLVIRTIPDDAARMTELLVGRVDVTPVFPAVVDRIRRVPTVDLIEFQTPAWAGILWRTRRGPLSNPDVRRALTMAIDRHEIVDVALRGYGIVGRATVTPFHPFFALDDPETFIPHDPDLARTALAELGWRDRRGDGLLRDRDGRPLRVVIGVIAAADQHRAVAQVIQEQLARIGVPVEILLAEYGALLQQTEAAGELQRFDAVIMGFLSGLRIDDSFQFHSRHKGAMGRLSDFTSPEIDSLLDRLATETDPGEQGRLWAEYQRVLVRESPATVLYYPRDFVAVSRTLDNVEADRRGILANVASWRAPDPDMTGRPEVNWEKAK